MELSLYVYLYVLTSLVYFSQTTFHLVYVAKHSPPTSDDEDGEPPLLLVTGKDEDGLTSRRGGSIGAYLDPLVEFIDEEKKFQEQLQQQQQQQEPPTQQNVIPSDLLNYFLSMADPAKVQVRSCLRSVSCMRR